MREGLIHTIAHPSKYLGLYLAHPIEVTMTSAALALAISSIRESLLINMMLSVWHVTVTVRLTGCRSVLRVHGATRRKHSLVAVLLTAPMIRAMKTRGPLVWGTMKVGVWRATAAADATPHPDARYASCRHPTPNTACRWSPAYTSYYGIWANAIWLQCFNDDDNDDDHNNTVCLCTAISFSCEGRRSTSNMFTFIQLR